MAIALIRRRNLPVPTIWGWLLLGALSAGLAVACLFGAESFLATTHRESTDVLVVEAWIGYRGLAAAKDEFVQGHYRYLVAAAGLSESPWERTPLNYADEAGKYLVSLGLSRDEVIVAFSPPTKLQRTHAMAVAARHALYYRGLTPAAINIFSLGAHARRSRLIFAKVFAPETTVGVIAWTPSDRTEKHWWQSSVRSEELLKESAGYIYELVLNSGRRRESPP
jgi:hypothetical protein